MREREGVREVRERVGWSERVGEWESGREGERTSERETHTHTHILQTAGAVFTGFQVQLFPLGWLRLRSERAFRI